MKPLMKKQKLFFILALVFLLFAPMVIALEDEAEEGTVSGEKIEDIRKEIQKKVEEKLSQITEETEKRAWIGIITEITETSLKIKARDGEEERTITLSDEVEIIGPERQEIDLEDLEQDQRIIAMGYLQIDTTLEAKRIAIVSELEERERMVVFGTINNKSEEDEIISISNSQENGEEYEIVLTSKTIIRQKIDEEVEEIEYEDLEMDQKIVAVLIPTESNGSTFNARLVFVLSTASSDSNETEE